MSQYFAGFLSYPSNQPKEIIESNFNSNTTEKYNFDGFTQQFQNKFPHLNDHPNHSHDTISQISKIREEMKFARISQSRIL
jgi:hypothetical protein